MDDWQKLLQIAQSVLIGFIFSFLLAKLISIVVSFREENLRIVRGDSVGEESKPSSSESKSIGENLDPSIGQELSVERDDNNVGNESSLTGDDSDDDWEGVESTELDEAFSAATIGCRIKCLTMCNCSFMGYTKLPPRDRAVRRSHRRSKSRLVQSGIAL